MALESPSLASPAHQMFPLGDSPGSSMFKIGSITHSFPAPGHCALVLSWVKGTSGAPSYASPLHPQSRGSPGVYSGFQAQSGWNNELCLNFGSSPLESTLCSTRQPGPVSQTLTWSPLRSSKPSHAFHGPEENQNSLDSVQRPPSPDQCPGLQPLPMSIFFSPTFYLLYSQVKLCSLIHQHHPTPIISSTKGHPVLQLFSFWEVLPEPLNLDQAACPGAPFGSLHVPQVNHYV